MRAAIIAAGGLTFAVVSYGLSRVIDGAVGAALFVVALAVIPIAIGFAIAAAGGKPRRSGIVHHWLGAHGLRRLRIAELAKCRACGLSRVVMESVWVCTHCDHAGAPR